MLTLHSNSKILISDAETKGRVEDMWETAGNKSSRKPLSGLPNRAEWLIFNSHSQEKTKRGIKVDVKAFCSSQNFVSGGKFCCYETSLCDYNWSQRKQMRLRYEEAVWFCYFRTWASNFILRILAYDNCITIFQTKLFVTWNCVLIN